MVVTFIGHGELNNIDEFRCKLIEAIESCINNGADIFYCGGYGDFDNACAAAIGKLKFKYPNIKAIFVTPYIAEGYQTRLKWIIDSKLYDEIIYPELEEVPYKFAISKRNEWMVDNADLVIAFVNHHFGGAYSTFQYAERKRKTIINIAD
ncbi:MAG: hypothetical protein RSC44_00930 [Clostridia bacterium]